MAVALASLATGTPVGEKLAMTGEITLRGRVMPVGGIKEKVLAASRAGMTDVILPMRNKKDLDEIPDEIRDKMEFHPVETMDEVLCIALSVRSEAVCEVVETPEYPQTVVESGVSQELSQ